MNIYSTDHSVLADPKDIPWLATLPPSSNLPSKENVEHATEESDGRSQWFDDGCGKKLYWENVPVYAVHGQEGLKGSSSNFELTWENENAKNDCTAPAEKSELFVNIGAEHEDNLGDRVTTSWTYWSRALQQNKAYYIAVPNEKYLLLIQHFIYKFPYFLRDENGLPVPEAEEESKKSSEYTDIRSIPFEDLTWNPQTNKGANAIHAYVPGCACAIDGTHTDITSASSVASSGWSKTATSGAWEADQSHSAFAQTSTQRDGGLGTGTGALFSVETDTGGIPTFTWVSGGVGYEVGDTLTFTDPYGLTEVCVLYVNGLGQRDIIAGPGTMSPLLAKCGIRDSQLALPEKAPPVATIRDEDIKRILGVAELTPMGKWTNKEYKIGEYVKMTKNEINYYFVAKTNIPKSTPPGASKYAPPNPDYWISDMCSKTLYACRKRWGAKGAVEIGETKDFAKGELQYGGFPNATRLEQTLT